MLNNFHYGDLVLATILLFHVHAIVKYHFMAHLQYINILFYEFVIKSK